MYKCVYTYTHTHAHTHLHSHKMKYSAMSKKIPLLKTTWMNLEGIVLSKISWKKTFCIISLICEIFKSQAQTNREQSGGYP